MGMGEKSTPHVLCSSSEHMVAPNFRFCLQRLSIYGSLSAFMLLGFYNYEMHIHIPLRELHKESESNLLHVSDFVQGDLSVVQ